MPLNPGFKSWLDGVEPAWTLLDEASFAALHWPPTPTAGPIRLAVNLTDEEIQQSAVARNAAILLRAAAAGPGLKMTATGNLSRGVVGEMCDLFRWPEFDKADAFQFNKVVNEPDFLPLFFVRHVVQFGKLLRKRKGHLRATPAGRKMLEQSNLGALQARLFHIALWHLDLRDLGGGFYRRWRLQHDIGVILWSLSVAANNWQPCERLTRLCAIPTEDVLDRVLDSPWNTASHAMEAQILRPLQWFGLLEHRKRAPAEGRFERRHFFRKTALFDRFLSFDVKLENVGGPHH